MVHARNLQCSGRGSPSPTTPRDPRRPPLFGPANPCASHLHAPQPPQPCNHLAASPLLRRSLAPPWPRQTAEPSPADPCTKSASTPGASPSLQFRPRPSTWPGIARRAAPVSSKRHGDSALSTSDRTDYPGSIAGRPRADPRSPSAQRTTAEPRPRALPPIRRRSALPSTSPGRPARAAPR